MIYIEAPSNEAWYDKKSVFLAGGITDCPQWQAELVKMLANSDLVLLNPRRENFPIDDPSAAKTQIQWEYEHLRDADAISFWFCKDTLCPIVLYELGAWSMTEKPIFVGVEEGYARRQDVEIQTALVRPDVQIESSLEMLADSIRNWYRADNQHPLDAGMSWVS